jgi:Secretion system C-terminal sorting domain
MKKIISVFSLASLVIVSSGVSNAQVMLQKGVISSGVSSASNSTMNAGITAGQPVIGNVSNSQMIANMGFWAPEATSAAGVAQTAIMQLSVDIFPNPVSNVATANITLVNASDLDVRLFDITGKEVKSIFSGNASSGTRSFTIDLSGLASGSYILAARIPGQIVESRVSLVRFQ